MATIATGGVAGGCGAGAAGASQASYAEPLGADGGAPTCDERAKSRALCLTALTQRCQSQTNDCDSTCATHDTLPGSTQKIPSLRGEFESQHCRESCRGGLDACLRSLLGKCPKLCIGESDDSPPQPSPQDATPTGADAGEADATAI